MHLIRTRQPSTLAPIDRSQQDAAGLVYEFAPWAGNRNLVAPQTLPVVAGPAGPWSGPEGLAYGNASANSYLDTVAGWGTESAADGACICVLYPYTSSGFFIGHKPSAWFIDITGSNEPRFWLGGIAAYTCSATITPQVWQTLGVVWRSGVTNGSQFYVNGRPLGNAFTISTLSAGSSNLFLFGRSSDEYASVFLAGARVFTRAKTDAEMRRQTGNFWGLYRRRPRADFVLPGASAAPTGTLSGTLAALTLSSNATVANGVGATLSGTLAALTLSSSATVANGVGATLSGTLAAVTLSSNAAVGTGASASVSATLAALTLSSSATVANGVGATLSGTLGALTLSSNAAVGTLPVDATLAGTLGALTLSSSATVANGVGATLAATLGALTVSSAAAVTTPGSDATATLAGTLGALVLSSAATVNAATDIDLPRTRRIGGARLQVVARGTVLRGSSRIGPAVLRRAA